MFDITRYIPRLHTAFFIRGVSFIFSKDIFWVEDCASEKKTSFYGGTRQWRELHTYMSSRGISTSIVQVCLDRGTVPFRVQKNLIDGAPLPRNYSTQYRCLQYCS